MRLPRLKAIRGSANTQAKAHTRKSPHENVPTYHPQSCLRAAVVGLLFATSAMAQTAVAAAATAAVSPANGAVATDGLTTEQFKAIAEEGFIYALPLVMNYAVMYEYAVDSKSSQFKAPFNHIKEHPACTPTRTPPLSPPTAIHRIRCCGWICAPNPW